MDYAIRKPPAVEAMSREELEHELRLWRREPQPEKKLRCIKPCFPVGCRLDDEHDGACLPYA